MRRRLQEGLQVFRGIVLFAAIAIVLAQAPTTYGQSNKPMATPGLMCTEKFCARIGRWVPSVAADGIVTGVRLRQVGSALGELGLMVGDVIVGVNEKRFSDTGLGLAEELRASFERRSPMNLV